MNFNPKSRQQKLVECLYPYFGELSSTSGGPTIALRVCRLLLACKTQAIYSPDIAPFIDIWNAEYPEENALHNSELLWGLERVNESITSQLHQIQVNLTRARNPKARMQVINGGLHEHPAKCYVDAGSRERDYDF